MTSSVCSAIDQLSEMSEASEFFQFPTYETDGGTVMDDLFESELMLNADTFDHRYRTISTSSVSSTLASYSASEIFPDIAGVMTADASDEYEICEELVLENDYSSADTTFMSPVRRRRRRHSSVRISISQMDANVVEMLDTLGFMARDLTRATDLVPGDIDLFWQSGSLHAADLAYERTECQRENSVPSVEVFAAKSDKVPDVKLDVAEEPVLVCAEDLAVSSDITSLLEQFEEEMKPFESSEVSVIGVEGDACHSVKCEMADSSCVDNSIPKTNVSSERMYVKTDGDCTVVQCEKLNIKSREGVSNSIENITECEFSCKKSAVCPLPSIVEPVKQDNISSAFLDEASATSRKKLKRTRSIDVKCQKVKEIAETVITEQKKMEMMEKARAISLKISRKEFAHQLESLPKSPNNDVKCEMGKAFRIPRLKNDQSKKPDLSIGFTSASEPIIVIEKRPKDVQVQGIKHEGVKSKKFHVPRAINFSSSSSIADSSIRSDLQQSRSSSAELSSHFVAVIPTDNSETELSKQSSEDSECSTSSFSGAVSSAVDPVDFAHQNDSVQTKSVSCDAKSKLLRLMPSREMIEKIASSTKQKSTILLPNAVPAYGERGTAIGIVNTQSSLKKAHVALTSVETVNSGLQLGQQNETQSSESGDTTTLAESGSDEKSRVQPSLASGNEKPLKRKLNLSEYKSILRERRKSLASNSGCQASLLQNSDYRSLASPNSKSQLSVVHVYGSCRQVGLDHDYCRRSDKDTGGVDVQDSNSSQSSECGSIGGSSDSTSQSTVLTRPLVAMAADDSSSEVMECKFMSQLTPSLPVIGTPAFSVLSSAEKSQSVAASEKFTSVCAVDGSLENTLSKCLSELAATTSLLKTAPDISSESTKEFRFGGCKPGSLSSVLRQDLILVAASESLAVENSSATVSATFILDASHSQSVKDLSRNDGGSKLSGIEEFKTTGELTENFTNKLDASSLTPVPLDVTSDDSICSSSTRSTSCGVPVTKQYSVGTDELKPEIVYIDHPEKHDQSGVLPMDCSETDAELCASGSGQTSGWQSSSSRSRSRIPRRYRRRKSYSSSSSSSSSSRSRSPYDRHWRSRSPSESRYRRRKYKLQSRSRSRSYYCSRSRSRSRSTSQCRVVTIDRRKKTEADQQREMEERRIVYVGRIPKHYTKSDLKRHLQSFGEIVNISVHFRSQGDDYGFVTFRSAADAFSAIEKGRSIPGCENFDFCFGGRRQFCRSDYADLDGKLEFEEEYSFAPAPAGPISHASCSFDELLNQATRQIRRRKS